MQSPLQVLKKYWGYDQFRSLQGDVIESVLQGQDTVALLHTGAGKSVCYQVPAMCLPGKALVVSPLIALMQDQVASLNAKGIMAESINSGLSFRKLDLILDNFMNGPLKILYVSPERLQTDIFLERFKKTNVSLIAVDEAHCISQWGHDFRPAYNSIKDLREWKPDVPVIAVTATATPVVIDDISEKLDLRKPKILKSSFGRENLSFTVMLTEEKMDTLTDVLAKMKGSGIIYMRSRSKVEALSKYLNEQGFESDYYHGGLNMNTRSRVQQEWIRNQTKIIVCTNAFGMGVDKPNVRFVIHCDIPPSIEEYYQEAGRGGRDGNMAFAISIIGYTDLMKLQKMHLIRFPDLPFLAEVYSKLCSYLKVGYGSGAGESFDVGLEDFCNLHRYPMAKVYSCLNIMEKEGWLILNEAFKKPSKIVITSDKGRISLSSRNKDLKAEMLLHFIRKYEGIFTDFVIIDEGKIANELVTSKENIVRELNVMDKEAILSYNPSTDLPRILFIKDRPAKDSFAIDEVVYKQRRSSAEEKMTAIQDYMTSYSCRQQSILSYFGEESNPCGKCDICKGSKDQLYSDKEKEKLFMHLIKIVDAGSITCDTYLQLWPYNKRNKAYACILKLQNEKRIEISDANEIHIIDHG